MERDERSSRAGQESVADIPLRQIASDKYDLRLSLLARPPLALRVAVQHHMHALEHEALGIALHRHDTLGAQDIRTLLLGELINPGHELGWVDVAIEPHRHRLHVLVVIVLEAVVMAAIVVMVVVIVVLLAYEEVRFDIENAAKIEA